MLFESRSIVKFIPPSAEVDRAGEGLRCPYTSHVPFVPELNPRRKEEGGGGPNGRELIETHFLLLLFLLLPPRHSHYKAGSKKGGGGLESH